MSDDAILITRIFDAPRERVFRAWTDPGEVAAWFGPAGVETPRDRVPHRPSRRRSLRADDGPVATAAR